MRLTIYWRVSTSHPVTVFISPILPSPISLRKESKCFLAIGLDFETGWPRMCISSGTTLAALFKFSSLCSTMDIRSLMYPSTLLLMLGGMYTSADSAGEKGVLSGRMTGSGIVL